MHGNATDTARTNLALAGVSTRAKGDAEPADDLDDFAAASHRTCRTVKGDEEAISGGVDFASAKALNCATDNGVMLCQQFLPGPVAHLGRTFRGADDIREHDRANFAHQIVMRHSFALEKSFVQRLRGWTGTRSQFLSQESPQLFVSQ